MKNQMLYRELGKYYDLIYSFKDYKREASQIKKIIARHKKSGGNELLDVACGTGEHLKFLKGSFRCMGVDVNSEMLNVARKKVRGVVFKNADMIKLNLNKKFDIVLCLFSSIGYVKTYANLKKTIRGFTKHMKHGGVVIIEPWFTRNNFYVGMPHMSTFESKDVKIARLNVSKKVGDLSVMDFHWLVAEKGKPVKHFVDRHEMALFDVSKVLRIMKNAGLQTKFMKKGLRTNRGLFIGVKK
jgi:ubiquinone/menaquinone biosynthesis C-methylase UbiE